MEISKNLGEVVIMYYNVDYEICAAVFMLVLIIMTGHKKTLNDYQSKLYRVYLYITFLDLCLDVISCYTIAYHEVVPHWLNYSMNALFLTLQFVLPTLFLLYVHFKVADVRKVNTLMFAWSFLPMGIGIFHMAINPWTKWIFYMDDTGYHHGTFHYYLYVNAALYAVGTFIYMFRARQYLGRQKCLFVVCVVIISLLPTLIQYFIPHCMLSGMGGAISVFMIYMTNENMTEYVDQITGALNREALVFHVNNSKMSRMPEQIFIIALDNFKIVNDIYGMDGGNRIMRMLVQELQSLYSDSSVFRYGGDNFVVTIEEKTEGIKELDRIRQVLHRKWILDGDVIELSACVGLVHSIHHDEDELFHAMEYAVSKAKSVGKGQFFEVEEADVADMARKAAIEQALVIAIEAGEFEVHYQPIFDCHSKRFHSMEALARLRVDGYGYVSPEEFIRIAEQNGTILQIGILVLDEVCRFIKQYDLKQKGIDFVEVNLSTVQCMQHTIYQSIMEVLERYDIPPAMINLEITESAAAYSEDLLTKNMARISLTDITFSLDDYGSGYSNVNYLVDLPFSIVKLDKYLVWAAMKKVTSRKILENIIVMFKAINLKVVAEGIEDLEMAELLISMGADYLQGYYFSKPVPKELLMERLDGAYIQKFL